MIRKVVNLQSLNPRIQHNAQPSWRRAIKTINQMYTLLDIKSCDYSMDLAKFRSLMQCVPKHQMADEVVIELSFLATDFLNQDRLEAALRVSLLLAREIKRTQRANYVEL